MNMITAEDVKRWHQLLVGKSEQAMIDDINKTLSHPTTLPSDEDIYEMMQKRKFITPGVEIGYQIGMKQMRSLCEAKFAEMEKEMKEVKQFISDVMNFADGIKVLDGEALQVLKNTARRVLSDKPTQLPRK